MRFTTRLLPSRSGNLGILMLNNPDKLHALTLDMIECLQDVLPQWYEDDSLAAILIKSSPPTKKVKAFCSGGDVKQVYLSGMEATKDGSVNGQGVPSVGTAEFFRQEYHVDYMLATSKVPHVCFWDGIVMGGGVGISIHARYRIATENTVWAMPETAIGLFPDVGSMYWMPRLLDQQQKFPQQQQLQPPKSYPGLAAYLACTGQRLKAADLLHTGIATHYVPSAKLPAVEAAIIEATTTTTTTTDSSSSDDVLAPVLDSFHERPNHDPTLDTSLITRAFGHQPSMQSIIETLQGMLSDKEDIATIDFARTTLDTLHKMSPTSLKITLEGLRRGAQLSTIAQDFAMEFRMSQACMRQQSDFYEGIRAVLIDKDHAPQWTPPLLADVTDDMVASYFAPIQHEWVVPEPLPEASSSAETETTSRL